MSKKGKIDSYNAFRGICALGILFSHMSYLSGATNPFWSSFYSNFMKYGSRCTSFFFIMSGFLLAYTWKDISFAEYIKGKLKKIYPLTICVFVLAVGCSFVLNDTVNGEMPIGSPLWFLSIILNVVLLKAFVPIESVFYSFHGPSWYISVLFVFYVVGYFVLKKLKNSENVYKIFGIMGGFITLIYIIQLALCLWVDTKDLLDVRLYLTYVNPYFRIFGEGFLGVLLCEYMPQIQEKMKDWNKDVLEIAALSVFIGFFAVNNFIDSSIWSAWVWFVPVSFVLIAFNSDSGVISKIAKGRLWQFLGNVSFELYMTHAFVYEGIPVAAGVVSKELRGWLISHAGTRFIITFILCVIVAWSLHRLMDWINKKIIYR